MNYRIFVNRWLNRLLVQTIYSRTFFSGIFSCNILSIFGIMPIIWMNNTRISAYLVVNMNV